MCSVSNLICTRKNKTCTVKDRLYILDGFICGRWDWGRNLQNGIEVEEFRSLLQLCVSVTMESGDDRVVWEAGASHDFTACNISTALEARAIGDLIKVFDWNTFVPKKAGFVSWRAALGRLPTRSTLESRGILIDSSLCPVCEEVEETVDHILVSCGLAQSLWCLIAQWCKVPPPFLFSFQDVLDLHNFIPVPREKDLSSDLSVYVMVFVEK
ncbi:uncharacterized protein LOC143538612 [Bidens hawaiensis]|uniref:uncharacterized protein LOC143538612 n=1 Tax=Bidens hawaiensis TaxID=980011 RepID=UPI004049A0CC